jgi:predicted AAA+ superfamily ATPase
VLRGKHKVYLADAAIGPSVLSKGKALLEDDTLLGNVVETAVFKHLFTRYYGTSVTFSYWRGKKAHEVDMIADVGGRQVPFEVKYRGQQTGWGDLKGLVEFCATKSVERGYAITRSLTDFGPIPRSGNTMPEVMRIPAPLFCYWLGKSELRSSQRYLSNEEPA